MRKRRLIVMATEIMSIQRGLSQLKLLDKKIFGSMNNGVYVGVRVGEKPIRGYKDDEEFADLAKAKYQSVTDLIKRRNAIKSAIVKANALTDVKVGDEVMTIAEAIERKISIQFEKEFLNELRQHHHSVSHDYERKEHAFKEKLDQHLETLYGKDGKSKAQENSDALKPFKDINEPHFIDPLNLKRKIEELQDYIDTFESEVDFSLSEINVKTEITIKY